MVVDEEEMKDPVSNFFHISVIQLPKHTELCCPALIRPSVKNSRPGYTHLSLTLDFNNLANSHRSISGVNPIALLRLWRSQQS